MNTNNAPEQVAEIENVREEMHIVQSAPSPDKELLYSYLFTGKITMEEYVFLCKKQVEYNIG